MRRSSTFSPISSATCSKESRVIPASKEPDNAGATTVASSPEPYEEKVHATHFFDVLALNAIEPDHLVAALFLRLCLSQQRSGIVAGKLRCTGATRCGADIIGRQPDGDRLYATFKVRARR